jgi:hypothetical protein
MGSIDTLLTRIRGEFLEMPGLCLTRQQACRLWQMDEATCDGVLGALVDDGFLTRTPAGAFVAAHTSLRPAKAQLRRLDEVHKRDAPLLSGGAIQRQGENRQ